MQQLERYFENPLDKFKIGFGLLYDSFWLGLESIHRITTAYNCALRYDMFDENYEETNVVVANVTISAESENYKIVVDDNNEGKYIFIRIQHSTEMYRHTYRVTNVSQVNIAPINRQYSHT